MEDFAKQVADAAQKSLLDIVRGGKWLMVDYGQRVNVPQSALKKLYESIDMNRVLEKAREEIEDKVAAGMVASLVTEIGNDVKQIMCNTELREELRGIIRDRIRAAAKAAT